MTTPRPLQLHVDDDGYVCDDQGKAININALPYRNMIVKAVNTHDRAKAALLDIARRYERDDCSQRREGNGVNVHITASAFKAIKALLADMEG